jgi:hypothetical protein
MSEYRSPAPSMPPLADRLRQQSNTLNTPMECEECTGTYFYDVPAHQYSRAGYGSVEFRQLTISPVPLRVCLCGHVVAPRPIGGKLQVASTPAFLDAMVLAARARQKNSTATLAEAVPSKKEFDELKALVAGLLGTPETAPEINTPAPTPVVAKAETPIEAKTPAQPGTPAAENLAEAMKKRSGRQKPQR